MADVLFWAQFLSLLNFSLHFDSQHWKIWEEYVLFVISPLDQDLWARPGWLPKRILTDWLQRKKCTHCVILYTTGVLTFPTHRNCWLDFQNLVLFSTFTASKLEKNTDYVRSLWEKIFFHATHSQKTPAFRNCLILRLIGITYDQLDYFDDSIVPKLRTPASQKSRPRHFLHQNFDESLSIQHCSGSWTISAAKSLMRSGNTRHLHLCLVWLVSCVADQTQHSSQLQCDRRSQDSVHI